MTTRSWPLVALVVLVSLVCWAWIVVLSRDMYGPMSGASAWMMTPVWNAPHLVLLWAMWAVMMTGMMLPSAAPMIVLAGGGRAYFMALGYVIVWAVFSAGATALQALLMRLLIVTPMMELSSRRATAILLALAGLYQLTPLKRACLTTCQAPMAFLARRWRSGAAGALQMGVEHGVVLRRLLLGVDAAAVCGRRHEPHDDRRADCVRRVREAGADRPVGRADQRRRADRPGVLGRGIAGRA